ncbi:hypothetical protein SUGI_1110600 [Cryptomeria japonica]|nr:hypothetical protein SUGI_1110600 [Cryptomeria japonica]
MYIMQLYCNKGKLVFNTHFQTVMNGVQLGRIEHHENGGILSGSESFSGTKWCSCCRRSRNETMATRLLRRAAGSN